MKRLLTALGTAAALALGLGLASTVEAEPASAHWAASATYKYRDPKGIVFPAGGPTRGTYVRVVFESGRMKNLYFGKSSGASVARVCPQTKYHKLTASGPGHTVTAKTGSCVKLTRGIHYNVKQIVGLIPA